MTRKDTDELLRELIKEGSWGVLLGADHAYKALLDSIRESIDPMKHIGKFISDRQHSYSIVEGKLSNLLGFPVHNTQIPKDVVLEINRLFGKRRSNGESDDVFEADGPLSRRTVRGILTQINDLARVGDPNDGRFGLYFVPYSDPGGIAAAGVKRRPTSFRNLALEDAIRLLKECRTWIDDYSVGILKLYAHLGEKLGELRSRVPARYVSRALSLHIRAVSGDYEREFGIPAIEFPWRGPGLSVSDLIRTLQAACAVMVMTNHGRRINEVVGEGDLPYGLYEGCLTRFQEQGIVRYELNIYIEKTVRDWAVMPANAGVARAIDVLERLLSAGRDIAAALGESAYRLRTIEDGAAKLFQALPLYPARNDLAPMFIWHDHSRWLLDRSGVDKARCNGQAHPFRRMFAQVYYYRYENADIRALSQWMGHSCIASTLTYVTDPASREDAERIEALHRRSNDGVMTDIRAFGREYLNDCLIRLLDEQPSGGGFTALALKVFRAMSGRANFPEDTPGRAKALTEWFLERGYEPEPNPHSACMVGENMLSRARSKCYDPVRKKLNKHEASAIKCSGCPHAYSNAGYLESNNAELERLLEFAEDVSLPAAVRDGARVSADMLRRVMVVEQRMQDGSLERMHAIYDEIAERLRVS